MFVSRIVWGGGLPYYLKKDQGGGNAKKGGGGWKSSVGRERREIQCLFKRFKELIRGVGGKRKNEQ